MAAATVTLNSKEHPGVGNSAKQLKDAVLQVLRKHYRKPLVQRMEMHNTLKGSVNVLVTFYYEPKKKGETLVGLEEIPF